jgi:hypothetical protein
MKTQSKIITVTLLCGAVILLLLISQYKSLNTHGNTTDKSRERLVNPAKVKRMPDQKRANPEKRNADKDTSARRKNPNVNRDKEPNGNADFYRVIVENNLFRPLGWQKPNSEPQYTLIATLIEPEGNMARALLMDRKSNQSYYVAIGEKVGDAIVKDIKSNQVTLYKIGDTMTIRAEWNPFLSSSSTNGGRAPTLNRGNRSNQNSENSDSKKLNLTEIKRRLQNASPEERKSIMAQYRKTQENQKQEKGKATAKDKEKVYLKGKKEGKIKPETRGNNQYEK